ncbi:hypothetical protein ASE61_19520 [Bosea sp. Root670]|nr:hypothetical protein ASE61_19520 [Bosea sp. Root670]
MGENLIAYLAPLDFERFEEGIHAQRTRIVPPQWHQHAIAEYVEFAGAAEELRQVAQPGG